MRWIERRTAIFNLSKPSYKEVVEAVRNKDSNRILMSIEVPTEYGKYQWSGIEIATSAH